MFKAKFFGALGLSFAISLQPAAAAYIGNGLYEVEYRAGEALKGESSRAYLYRQAFSDCRKVNKGFRIEEHTKGQAPTLSFRCEGPIDERLAAEVKARHLAAVDGGANPMAAAPVSAPAPLLPEEEFAKAVAESEEAPAPAPRAAPAETSPPTAPDAVPSAPSRSAYANVMGGAYVGLSHSETSFLVSGRLGGDVYAHASGTIALGLLGGYSGEKIYVGADTAEAHTSVIVGELISRKNFGTGLYYGLRAGIAFRYAKFSSGLNFFEGYGTAFAWGPVVGYEFPPSSKLKANLELFLLSIGESRLDTAGSLLRVNSSTGLVIQGGVLFDI